MDREFNLIDEPWICVRDNGCEVKEIINRCFCSRSYKGICRSIYLLYAYR